ncbi:hypothetical protein BDZ97DRAFT_1925426 [Flammula alnicola]|nr:hypothetical protein BDZ97DRAFT_1925426 [Flammula alnicola]
MSQPQEIPPIPCITCGRLVHYSSVKSDTNGNKGRLLAKCVQVNPETGTMCNFFRWLAGSRTPSLSPRLGSTNQLPAVAQPGGPAPLSFYPVPGIGDALVPPRKPTCLTVGCNSTRIRKDCGRRMCKAHCREAGGCADPAHKGSQSTAIPYMAAAPPPATPIFPVHTHLATASLNGSSMPPSSIDPNLPQAQSQVRMRPPSPSLAPSSRVPVHTRTEPAFTSHMSPVYTAQMALEEQMRENNRQMEATRLESKRKVQQTAYVYAWMEDDTVPAPFEVQEGFVWPHFILNEAVLLSAGFPHVSPDMRFNIFRFNLGHWTTVKLNHVVELKETPRVFIKATHVQRCQHFEKFLISTSSSATAPNIRTNLAGERAYVKKRMTEHELSQASKASFLKNKHSLSPDNLASTPKRPRHQHDESPTPTLTRYRPPVPAPKFIGRRAPGVTRVVKKTRAAREREIMEGYDSDSGIEFTDPFPFTNSSPAPSTSRSTSTASVSMTASASAASTSAASTSAASASAASTSIASTSIASMSTARSAPFLRLGPTVKQEEPSSAIPFLIPAKRISKKPKWPADFFAVDIVNLFDEIEDSASDTDTGVRSLFERHFGQWVDYKRSTYYDHRQRWEEATLEAKQAVLSAGQTKAGCWINLMSTTRAPRAHIKAVRRHNTKQVLGVAESDVIDISSDSDL